MNTKVIEENSFSAHRCESAEPSSIAKKQGIVISSLNVNGLLRNIDEIKLLIKEGKVSILAVIESKVDNNIADELISIDGYKIVRLDRNKHGGGLAIYQ